MEVYNTLGAGFLEAVYQEAMEIELALRGVPFEPQKLLPIHYKGRRLKKKYLVDFVCYDSIVVEIKALDNLSALEHAIFTNYMRAGTRPVGLLMNFGARSALEWKRKVHTRVHPPPSDQPEFIRGDSLDS